MLYFSSIHLLLLFKSKINWEQLPDSCIFLYLENVKDFLQNKKLKRLKYFQKNTSTDVHYVHIW